MLLTRLLSAIDALTGWTGQLLAWLLVPMVVGQFVLVLLRYVFGVGSIWGQEAVLFAHGAVFMGIAALVLRDDRHVRVDVLYRRLQPRRRALVDVLGLIVFLLPLCALMLITGWPYVATSWATLEGSRETAGLPLVFLHKTFILVFAGLVGLQGLAILVRKLLGLLRPPRDC